ncbi:MAG: M56 family metallopeptidase [Oscillospiraceae bacterium]|jgi:beta-lactamase regulating signal transducer with metallopeptidase domain|nr:M56 family metallopeptidase [Oscillospiraceae bacterium]
MNSIFQTVLSMSITASFIIAVLAAARLILKKLRAPKWVSYVLWAIAGIRMAVPINLKSVFSFIPQAIAEVQIPDALTQPFSPAAAPAVTDAVNAAGAAGAAAAQEAAAVPAVIENAINWQDIFARVWLIGVAVMVLYAVVSYISLMRRRGRVRTPFVYGFFRPKIHIPDGLPAEELRYVTLHEQTHIKRRDHIVKLFAFALLCVHWFNPFAWLAFVMLCADMEMSCDERVIKQLGPAVKADYSMAILSLAVKHRILNASPLAFGEGGMKTRIKNVLNFKKPSRVIILAAAIIAVALTAGLLANRQWQNPKVAPDGMRALYLNPAIADSYYDSYLIPYYSDGGGEVIRQMKLRAVYSDNTIKSLLCREAKLSSSNEKIFTVNENGTVKSTGLGEATLYAEYNGFRESIKIKTYEVSSFDRIELVAPGFFEAADEDKAKYILPEVIEITPIGEYRRADGGLEGVGNKQLAFDIAYFKGDECVNDKVEVTGYGITADGFEGVLEDASWENSYQYSSYYHTIGPGTVNFTVSSVLSKKLTVIVHDYVKYFEPPIGTAIDLPILPDDKIGDIDHIAFVEGSGKSANDGLGDVVPKNGKKIGEVPARAPNAWEEQTVPKVLTSLSPENDYYYFYGNVKKLNVIAITKDGEMYALDKGLKFSLKSEKLPNLKYQYYDDARIWAENGVWTKEAERYYATQTYQTTIPDGDLLVHLSGETICTVTAQFKEFSVTISEKEPVVPEDPWLVY